MAEDLLQAVFPAAVQAFLSAGWPKGGKRGGITQRRSANAFRCLCGTLAGAGGRLINQDMVKGSEGSRKSCILILFIISYEWLECRQRHFYGRAFSRELLTASSRTKEVYLFSDS